MLDIFFEVLNYETIEQKKAYEIAGLLGELLVATCPLPMTRAWRDTLPPEAGCSPLSHTASSPAGPRGLLSQ